MCSRSTRLCSSPANARIAFCRCFSCARFGLVKWGPLLEAGLTVASLPFGSLLGLFLLGTLDRRANARGALVGMFAGLVAILCVFGFTKVAFTWYVLIGASVTFATGWAVSRARREDERVPA